MVATETDIKIKTNVFLFKIKNSCGTSIARASLDPRRGRRRARLIGERCRRLTPTAAAGSHRTPGRPPTKVGTALALVVHRAQSPGGCPRPVDTRTPGRRRRRVTRAHRRTVTVRRVYMQSTSGSSTSRRCSLCCSVWWWWWWSSEFGSRTPTVDTSPRPTDSDGRGPHRCRMQGRVV